MSTEKAIGINRWELLLELRKRYQLISLDLDGNQEEYIYIKEIAYINDIYINYVQMEEEWFSKPLVGDRIKENYNQIIN
jgi:hypothetical protein